MLDLNKYVFQNRLTGEYWLCKGRTVTKREEATKFDSDQAARFYRSVNHPNKWKKVQI